MAGDAVRITYLTQYFRTPAMSGGQRPYEFARRLAAAGHRVSVVSGPPPDDGPPRRRPYVTDEAGVRVHWLPVPCDNRMAFRRRIRAFAAFAAAASARAVRLPADLVFATSTPLTIAVPGAAAARRWRAPLVLEVRDLWPDLPIDFGALRSPAGRWAGRALEGWAYRRADRVIGVTPGIVDSIRRRFPATVVDLVPNGTDRDVFAGADAAGARLRAREPWLGDRPLLLYAGTVGLANDVEYLIRIAAALAPALPAARVAIVGTGNRLGRVRALAAAAGLLDRTVFLRGAMSKAEAAAWFGASTVTVSTLADLPSLQGSAPNKVFDSLAARRPVALTYGGWLTDLLVANGAGLRLPPGDPGAAAAALADLLRDPERLRVAGAAAGRVGERHFSRDDLFDRFHGLLLAAAGTRRIPTPVA
ncbi:glycosyltransferase WbuB [Pilimelia anulata]|uniref:Glycosyltransferase WbuB n=1 Tax=Pilimelia anulata TaxID=53371 RepID=A0A8J3F8Z0_9ACTN|nr:glycosyltransferase family 4 protein [Pilimelia anulata]GGJ91576.1 glycosyltransferase WbuB [Pilimelia anulata]